ncbi:MAG: phosphopyruvate hydratase [Candidatus Levybacteria bacterium RIFCSPLOWO2_01_FULL_36_13]|nr:MAG: phosphopyruvate hydratase [Candidatus Levybacteria bacterium RIFCSPHIGHO2_01_FULL_36_15b]OGH35554.1 MAG: phosphopyruvate hydratase [Candidatus Levybacteria bacterium RIFCSPLOWO2_01_FULL_36_13]
MAKIKTISAREILNSKGEPTIETTVILSDGAVGISSVPSGTSIGKYEALELRDNDEKRFEGKGVLNAVNNVQKYIFPAISGMEASNLSVVDKKLIELDGTSNKQKLGANSILSVSIAVAKAAAKSSVLPTFLYLREFTKKEAEIKVPTPSFNILNGGKHGDGNIDFQEFLAIPASSKTYSEGLMHGINVYSSLKKTIQQNNLSTLTGLEGGFSPKLASNQDGLLLIKQAIEAINLRLGFDMFIGLDPAANEFYLEGNYRIKDKATALSSKELIEFYTMLNSQYHLLYLEDGLAEDDWGGWQELYTTMSKDTLIVGDDLIASNPFRLQEAIQKNTIGGVVIKPNQIGTVIEALAVCEMAKQAGLKVTVSHRSGETTDDFIADFAVAAGADYVKFGAPVRGERVAKYNRLLAIEKQIASL